MSSPITQRIKQSPESSELPSAESVPDALAGKPINIVVDPRKPKAAGPVDLWLPLRPATDAALALGWMNVIINEELYDKEFVEKYCHGFEELRQAFARQGRDEVHVLAP